MKTEINLKLLALVMGVYSVSHATIAGVSLNVTYRETEDDNSSWSELSIFELQHAYKIWARANGYNVLSDTFGAYVTILPKKSVNDCDFSVLDASEIKAVRLACENIYKIKEENEEL